MSEDALHVEPIKGEALRYRVRSASRTDLSYVVDLSEYQGNGQCTCPDFLCRREPNIKKGKPLYTRLTMCKHVMAARIDFLNTTLAAIAAKLHP